MPNPQRDLTDPRTHDFTREFEHGLVEPIFENIEVPQEFGPVTIRVDEHKVKRFAFVTDDYSSDIFRVDDGGLVPIRAPAALLANDLLQLFTLRFAPSAVVGLHTEQQMWFDKHIEIGELVVLRGAYIDAYEQRGEGYVVMEATASNERGEVLVRHRGVEIMRTNPANIDRGTRSKPDQPRKRRRITAKCDADAPVVLSAGRGLRPGMQLRDKPFEVTVEQMALFSRSGEFVRNIHNDLLKAKDADLERPIAQGQMLFCLMSSVVEGTFGSGWANSGHMISKFLQPVPACSDIMVQGIVHDVRTTAESERAELDLWVSDGDRPVAVAWAEVDNPVDRQATLRS